MIRDHYSIDSKTERFELINLSGLSYKNYTSVQVVSLTSDTSPCCSTTILPQAQFLWYLSPAAVAPSSPRHSSSGTSPLLQYHHPSPGTVPLVLLPCCSTTILPQAQFLWYFSPAAVPPSFPRHSSSGTSPLLQYHHPSPGTVPLVPHPAAVPPSSPRHSSSGTSPMLQYHHPSPGTVPLVPHPAAVPPSSPRHSSSGTFCSATPPPLPPSSVLYLDELLTCDDVKIILA